MVCAPSTREAYLAAVTAFVRGSRGDDGPAGTPSLLRAHAISPCVACKRQKRSSGAWAPASVNQALAVIDPCFASSGLAAAIESARATSPAR